MRRLGRFVGGFVMVLCLVFQVKTHGQEPRSFEAQLKAAEYRAEVQGDWKGAISEFVRLSKVSDRAVAAKSLVALGDAYQKTGAGDARSTFTRVVRTFPDQKDATALANRRLAMSAKSTAQSSGPRRLWSSAAFNIQDITSDGELAIGRGQVSDLRNQLLLRKTATGQETILVPVSQEGSVAAAFLAPGAQRVAFGWISHAANTHPNIGRPSVRVIDTAPGSTSRTLYAPEAPYALEVVGWTGDGQAVLCVIDSVTTPAALIAVRVSDGVVRTIRTFADSARPGRFRTSDDGLWIAYEDWMNQRIHVMNAEGQLDTEVVKWTGGNQHPVWTPSGSHILFTSNRSGSWALYSVPVQNGAATAEPSLIQAAFTGIPTRVLQSGTLVYKTTPNLPTVVLVAERTPGAANVLQTFSGSSPVISPDGQSVLFDLGPGALTVRSLVTGTERVYKRTGIGAGTGGGYLHSRWLPDSSGLIVWVTPEGDGGREGGSFYHLDLKSGQFTWRFARVIENMRLSRAGALSSDGQTMFFLGRPLTGSSWTHIVHVDPSSGAIKASVPFVDTGLPPEELVFSLALSPDDRTLAIGGAMSGQEIQIGLFSIPTAGGSLRLLAAVRPSRSPDRLAWTPDGRAVLVGVVENDAWKVMSVPAEGGTPQFDSVDLSQLKGTVTIPPVLPGAGSYGGLSRDGSRIVFSATPKPVFEVWALDQVLTALSTRQ